MKCANCEDHAEQNFTWLTSKGNQSANLCGFCASEFWAKFKNTPSGQSLIIDSVKSNKEIAELAS